MIKFFLSYRRSDSQEVTGRIYDRLADRFSPDAVFRDLDSIPLGDAFASVLKEALARTSVALIIIGPGWARASSSGNRTLADADDYVRVEIEQALSSSARVVPVLVSHAALPRGDEIPESMHKLLALQAVSVRPDPDFHRDMDRLIADLAGQLGIAAVPPSQAERKRNELAEFLSQVSMHQLPTADSAAYFRRVVANRNNLAEIAEEMAATGAVEFEKLLPIFDRYKRLLPRLERRQLQAIVDRVQRTVREYQVAATQPHTFAIPSSLPGASLRVDFQRLLTQTITWEMARADGDEPEGIEYVDFLINLSAASGVKDDELSKT
jgi:TIR domain-containing protein